jgi:hypothetical protein
MRNRKQQARKARRLDLYGALQASVGSLLPQRLALLRCHKGARCLLTSHGGPVLFSVPLTRGLHVPTEHATLRGLGRPPGPPDVGQQTLDNRQHMAGGAHNRRQSAMNTRVPHGGHFLLTPPPKSNPPLAPKHRQWSPTAHTSPLRGGLSCTPPPPCARGGPALGGRLAVVLGATSTTLALLVGVPPQRGLPGDGGQKRVFPTSHLHNAACANTSAGGRDHMNANRVT